MIGDFQTDALHEALAGADIDDLTLLGLFVLAASGGNVDVRTGDTSLATTYGARDMIAGAVVENGMLSRDPETIRASARRMLRYMLSLRQGNWQSNSGPAAQIAGDAIGADAYLATMATQEFLACLSKSEMERVASANAVPPRQTGKATRSAFIERFKDERYLYDGSGFALTEAEQKEFGARVQRANGIRSSVMGSDEPDLDDESRDDEGEAGEMPPADKTRPNRPRPTWLPDDPDLAIRGACLRAGATPSFLSLMEATMKLITDEHRATMLANDQHYEDDPAFDPIPVVKVFNPLGSATWLLCSLDRGDPDIAFGLCDLGFGSPEVRVRSDFRNGGDRLAARVAPGA